ncbi:MAG TPA: site-specific integrase [Anaeromyxobacteraceae bacterium]|nr:site-specific integrase [Anaeromyxobacteraceae bacterium]
MGVMKYESRGRLFWQVDETLVMPDGREVRMRKRRIPTKELAVALVAKARADAFEGRYFERLEKPKLTVAEAWGHYEPINKRDNDSWQSEEGRARQFIRHLGSLKATELSQRHVDEYRTRRLGEKTRRGSAPSPATLDREVELLKRILNYAVACGRLTHNPIAKAKLLRKPNVRRMVVSEEDFQRLHAAADECFKPILAVAYETGMRKREVLDLRWEQLDLKEGVIRLLPQDTKAEDARIVYLTPRAHEAVRGIVRRLGSAFVFLNPQTGEPWVDVRKQFVHACKAAGLAGVWFHDLRRSFVTNARRYGVPESVVMRMSGHKTRAVFERYNVVAEEDLRDAVRKIEGARLRQETVKVSLKENRDPKAPSVTTERA